MKNAFGTQENLKLYHKNGEIAYNFFKSGGILFCKIIYNENGRETSYEDSNGYSWEKTYHETLCNIQTSFKDSEGFWWNKTHDEAGNLTLYEDSHNIFAKKTYNKIGLETSYEHSSGVLSNTTYDNQNRITSYKNSNGGHWRRIYNEDGSYKQINL